MTLPIDFLAPHDGVPPDEFADVAPAPIRRLREAPLKPVPPSVVRHVQAALDGLPDPDDPEAVVHSASHTFPAGQEHRAKAYAAHLKNAGAHTVPPSSVTVDYNESFSPLKVSFRVGKPRAKRRKPGTVDVAQG